MIHKVALWLALALAGGCSAASEGPPHSPPTLTPSEEVVPKDSNGAAHPNETPSSTATQGTDGKADGSAPADVDGPPVDSITTASGLSYLVLTKGHGTVKATEESNVLIHYSGWTTAGRQFDTTRDDGPVRLRVDALVAGLTEGLQLMAEGDRLRFWLPSPLAYGDSPRPDQPRGMLVFDVELLEIQ
ncbi:MAG: FKBP-type peptidyl-prolyl cis-trans isomerase [Deltaproteobacteria bacterium]|nr:MAG: FKBP-type peptidyl-prolyl cis-trans isomerase [Deltaproteobacteria bacterium]